MNIGAHREGNTRGMHGEHTLGYKREYKMDIPGDIPKEHITKKAHGESMGNTRGDIPGYKTDIAGDILGEHTGKETLGECMGITLWDVRRDIYNMDVPGIFIRGEHSEENTLGGSFGKHTGDIRWIYWGNT